MKFELLNRTLKFNFMIQTLSLLVQITSLMETLIFVNALEASKGKNTISPLVVLTHFKTEIIAMIRNIIQNITFVGKIDFTLIFFSAGYTQFICFKLLS